MPIIRFESRDNNDRNNPRKIEVSETKKVLDERREARENSNIAIELTGSFSLSRKPSYCRSIYISNIGYNMLVNADDTKIPADPRNNNLPAGLKFSYKWKYGYAPLPDFPDMGYTWFDHNSSSSGNFNMEPVPNSNRLAWYHLAKDLTREIIGISQPALLGVEVSIIDENTNQIYASKLLNLGRIQDPGPSMNVCYITKQESPGVGVPDEYHPYSVTASSVERGNLLIARSDHWPRKINPDFNEYSTVLEYIWYRKPAGSQEYVQLDPEFINYHPWILPYNPNPEEAGEGINQGIVIPDTLFEPGDSFKAEAVLSFVDSGDGTEDDGEERRGNRRYIRRASGQDSSDPIERRAEPELEVAPLPDGDYWDDNLTDPDCPCCKDNGCLDCFYRALNLRENSGEPIIPAGEPEQPVGGGIRGCNTAAEPCPQPCPPGKRGDYCRRNCVPNPNGPGGNYSHGPFQQRYDNVVDSCKSSECRELCERYGGADGVWQIIKTPCPTAPRQAAIDCCQRKFELGKALVKCYSNVHGVGGESCRCHNSPYPFRNFDENCCSCEEIAKFHTSGTRGPCDDGQNVRDFWNQPLQPNGRKGVRLYMLDLCPECACPGPNFPEVKGSPDLEVMNELQGYGRQAGWINGFYPLYQRKQDADKASPSGTSHEHIINGAVFYMPDGVPYVHDYTQSGDSFNPNDKSTRQEEVSMEMELLDDQELRGTCCVKPDRSQGDYGSNTMTMTCIEDVTEEECQRNAFLVGDGTNRWFKDGPSCSACPCNDLTVEGLRTVQDSDNCPSKVRGTTSTSTSVSVVSRPSPTPPSSSPPTPPSSPSGGGYGY